MLPCRKCKPNACWSCPPSSSIAWATFRASPATSSATWPSCSRRAHQLPPAARGRGRSQLQAVDSLRDFSLSRRGTGACTCFSTPAAKGRARAGCTANERRHRRPHFGRRFRLGRRRFPATAAYEEGMRRELAEEVTIDTPYSRAVRRPDQRRREAKSAGSTWAWSTSLTSRTPTCARWKTTSAKPASARSTKSWPHQPASKPGRRFACRRCLARRRTTELCRGPG